MQVMKERFIFADKGEDEILGVKERNNELESAWKRERDGDTR